MVTTLCLVRHGETEGSDIPRYKGSLDVPLSPLGHEQVRHTAGRLRDALAEMISARRRSYLRAVHEEEGAASEDDGGAATPEAGPGLDVVYCSPLIRAVASAEYIAAPHGLTPVVEPDLRERHFGVWEGLSFAEIKRDFPDVFTAWAADPVRFAPPGGENTLEVSRRGRTALEAILARHPGQNVAVVAHGGINRVILCHLLGVPLENIFRLEQDLACFNLIEIWDQLPVVKLLNAH